MSLIRKVIEELFEGLEIKTKHEFGERFGYIVNTFGERLDWSGVYDYVEYNEPDAWNSVKTPRHSIRYYGQKMLNGFKNGPKDIVMAELPPNEEYIKKYLMDKVVMAEVV